MFSDSQLVVYIGIAILILILVFPAMEGAIIGAAAAAGFVEVILRRTKRHSR